jgi:hypothetical protein
MPIYLADFTKQNSMGNDRHIWEGWTVNDFIKELEITFPYQNFKTKDDVKQWCKSEQPYYKKHIPEVAKHFIQKARL